MIYLVFIKVDIPISQDVAIRVLNHLPILARRCELGGVHQNCNFIIRPKTLQVQDYCVQTMGTRYEGIYVII